MSERCSSIPKLCTFLCLVLAPLAASCDSPQLPAICSDEYVYGLHIEISDAGTGEAVGEGASILVKDGSYEETPTAMPLSDKVIAYAAGERPGEYTISVDLEGYEKWYTAGIAVGANRCHVITEVVHVALIRER